MRQNYMNVSGGKKLWGFEPVAIYYCRSKTRTYASRHQQVGVIAVAVVFIVVVSNFLMIPTHVYTCTHTYLVKYVYLSLKIVLVVVPLGEFPAMCSIFLAAHINFTTFVDCATVTVASHPIDKRNVPYKARDNQR